jgi:hypothetical protein
VDFEKVQNEEENLQNTTPGGVLGNRWYRVPQLRSQGTNKLSNVAIEKLIQVRRSPTIDASSICAILFWLLTNIVPKEDDDAINEKKKKASLTTDGPPLFYHQQVEETLINIVKNTVQKTERGKLCPFLGWSFSFRIKMEIVYFISHLTRFFSEKAFNL